MKGAATQLSRRIRAAELDGLPHEWDTRYELIGGVLHMSRRPSHRHQQILGRLGAKVGPAVLDAGGDVVPEPGIVWDDDGDDNVAPDFVFLVGSAPPPPGEKLRACPEIVVEVLSTSPEDRRRDLVDKRQLYWRRGALEYWILDPDAGSVLGLVRGSGDWDEQRLAGDEVLTTPLLPRWAGVRVRDLFPAARGTMSK
jgi:Uma2 family endonuclease